MATTFARGAQTMNTMFVKPIMRKTYHKKSSSPDSLRETKKLETEEVKSRSSRGDTDGNCWVPHEKTGIYYPKGQEKVMADVPHDAAKDFRVNWFTSAQFDK